MTRERGQRGRAEPWIGLGLAIVAVTACQVLPKSPPPAAVHDLGISTPGNPAGSTTAASKAAPGTGLGGAAVTAPPWMGSTDVHYRFLFEDPTQLRSYSTHRWASPPATLLEGLLRGSLASSSSAATPSRGRELRVSVQRFEQQFDSPGQAHAVVEVSAEVAGPDGRVAGPRRFRISRTGPPDVQGAVATLATAARELTSQVLRWADQATTPRRGGAGGPVSQRPQP